MIDVAYDKAWASNSGNPELYYMYHNLALSKRDRERFREMELRYDIMTMPSIMMGEEYVKTMGHMNPPIPNTNDTYSELHEVLNGEAHFIIQRSIGSTVEDVYLVRAEERDKVIIPPGYGYVIVNPSNKQLRVASIVSLDAPPQHEPYRRHHGAAFFELRKGIVKNENYENVPNMRVAKPSNFSIYGLKKNEEIYGLVNDIMLLEYINVPQKYLDLFEKVRTNK